ncbi:ferredoxin reductase [Actinocrispum sp. NPDC049592]|uniref:ferredoxin reductase n=1 Tax=Actinocrispum sp. NPDC049592 TaxID=3154835 RepID=UPI0034495F5B
MAGTAVSRRLGWRVATLVDIVRETATASTLVLDVPGWPGHLAGQHIDLRLTAEDGYTAQRSYSMSAPADGDRVEVTVQRVTDGEVSPFLVDEFTVGSPIEIRGPVGRWFVWRPRDTAPVLLIAGGSGIVPLMSMIRARRQEHSKVPFRLIYSVRTPEDRCYATELARPDGGLDVSYVYTRPSDGPRRRIGIVDITTGGWPPDFAPQCFICGPNGFVETAANILIALGHDTHRIKTERFG